ncbi:MAG: methylmalonyl-CoA mutase [Desulfarculaceae bacterium]|nr:methylmalonyl-CoA mutase [Desulfarculaceae bacterium]MCF8073721.1 methylmalonyl-CoA mutase [Desulfarculaceae bacterium]MCF8101962.1 methylmalonyl-CoA mutase [Desulfarculaceae bacterium]MCF8115932.1 methylmalonyl-CoA mutase [Desulfarculaceae bacterium]
MSEQQIAKQLSLWEQGPMERELQARGERKESFATPSGIEVKRLYTPLDLEQAGQDYNRDLGYPGQFPFTRGKDPLGYRANHWLFMQYAGFGDAAEANKRYRYLLAHGGTGISIALDLPTQLGLDSDDPLADGEVGRIGVALDSLQDLETVFDGIPLDQPRQISLVANAMSSVGLAMFVALAKKQGVDPAKITLRIQNDILKEFISRGTYIYPPGPSLRLSCDLIEYCARNHPNWLPLTLCGYHLREAGSDAVQEVAISLADGLAYLDEVAERGVDLEKVLPQLSAFMSVNMNFMEEIAKFRVMRRLWARLAKERYGVKDPDKLGLALVNFTAGSSLTAQQPMNNVVRVAIECLAGVLGGCQSLFPCSYDEAFCTPTEESVKLALRTQQIIAHESGLADTIDPLGGSYFLESLTEQIEAKVRELLDETEKQGGAVKCIENQWFRRQIDESAYEWQKKVDAGEQVVVGVNAFTEDVEPAIEIFRPPVEAQQRQINKLKTLRASRDPDLVEAALNKVAAAAREGSNTIPAMVEAVEAYATIGEICGTMAQVFGLYRESGL